MHVIVAGCGRVGATIAESLSGRGHDVVVLDSDPRSFSRLGRAFNGMTVEGVAFDEETLLEAGIESAHAFAAVTNFDSTNLMASEIATSVFKVPKVVSRLYNPDKELTFFKMGIDYICGTTLMTNRIMEKLFQDEDLIVQEDIPSVGLQVVEALLPEEAEGKPASDLNYGVSSRVIMLFREGKLINSPDGIPLRKGDRAILILRKEGWETLKKCLWEGKEEECEFLNRHDEGKVPPDHAGSTLSRKVIIGGCSQVGAHLGYLMSIEGHDVTIIDENPDLFRRLPPRYEGKFLEGVVFEEDVLLAAGIKEADAFVAVTKFDNKNLMAAEVARHIFNVPHVMARLFNPDKEGTYQALGINYLCGTRLLSQAIVEYILEPRVKVTNSCLNNVLDLVEFECPSSWDSRKIESIRNKLDIVFAYIIRRGSGYMPDPGFVLRKGDHITALADRKALQKLEKSLQKNKG